MVRNSTRFVWYQDLKKLCADLKAVYSAPAEQAGRDAMEGFGKIWNDTYPMLYPGRDRRRQDLGEFFTYPPEIRRGISTTHAVESLNYQLRKVTKKRPALVDDEAVYKILYLAIRKACGKRAVPIRGWGAELIRRYFRQGTGSVLNWTLPFTQKNLQAPSMTAN
jgi:transposase-like protein